MSWFTAPSGFRLYFCPAYAVELSLHQVCLLHALRDFPSCAAPTRGDWVRAAQRYLRHVGPKASYRRMARAARTLPGRFVRQQRGADGIRAELLPRGRRLTEGRDYLWVDRIGLWPGFEAVARKVEERRQRRELAMRRRPPRPRQLTYREHRMREWLASAMVNMQRCSVDAPVLAAAQYLPDYVARRGGTHAWVRADLWGGPCDGESVVLGLHPAPDLVFHVEQPDGSSAKVHYVLDREPVLDVEVVDEGQRVPTIAEVAGRLKGRGVRYRLAGMV